MTPSQSEAGDSSDDKTTSSQHIDEDWKTRVQNEKQPDSIETEVTDHSADESSSEEHSETVHNNTPPATLEFLFHTLYTQALMALGRIANPITGKTHRREETARHFIDPLSMLEHKTIGNRTTDETKLLDDILHQLRMIYAIKDHSKLPGDFP